MPANKFTISPSLMLVKQATWIGQGLFMYKKINKNVFL